MAVGPQGIVTFVGTRKDKVWSVTDRNKDRVADEVKDFAPSLTFTIPNGPASPRTAFSTSPSRTASCSSRRPSSSMKAPTSRPSMSCKQGELIPAEEESFNHTARVCKIGPDSKLYISLGQPFNVPPPEKLELYHAVGHRRHHPHESGRHRARGLHLRHPQLGRP